MPRTKSIKRPLQLGVIVGNLHDDLLSLDGYLQRFLLPFSPRFRSIDFAVGSLRSADIEHVMVFCDDDKEFVRNYLTREWPFLQFQVYNFSDLNDPEFLPFFEGFLKEQKISNVALIHGDYPVWFDFKSFLPDVGRQRAIALSSRFEGEWIYPAGIFDKNAFLKFFNLVLKTAVQNDDRPDFSVPTFIQEHDPLILSIYGYFMPIQNIDHYFRVHLDMLEDYHFLDHLNSIVPVRSERLMNNTIHLQKDSHIVNSIFGEGAEISGYVENSVILGDVKVAAGAVIRNSVILPGNHIARKTLIENTLIDEFSGDNSLPNIEKNSTIGHHKRAKKNTAFPDALNTGFTLIGKDCIIPARSQIGANCYIESFTPSSRLKSAGEVPDGESVFVKD